MANFQSWGLNWFNTQRNEHMVEDLSIVHSGGTLPVQGSVIDPESTVNSQGLRVKSDKARIIVNTADISGVTLRRGVKILRGSDTYEVIIDRDEPSYFNDPNKIETVIPVRLLCS